MNEKRGNAPRATGRCLCGAVKFEVHGELLPVINCHCSKCRRFNGNVGAYASTGRENLVMTKEDGLKWYRSEQDETPDVYRGFCSECGSGLFWDPRGKKNISVAAGSLDEPTHLETVRHVWVAQKGDYYMISDDLPQSEEKFARADREDQK